MTSAQVLSHFREIMTIPRESGHEEHIIAYLQKFAADRGMDCRTDEAGNVLITIPATPGRENAPTLILQSHSDMVCEKNSGVEHDFSKDPIKAVVEDGWLIAKDTTLGADCGIGIAAQLAVLEDKELPHGRIECLFTTSEETGLDGAFALKPDFLTGSILLNLDSEDEGELFIGCAGGIDTTAKFHYTPVPVPAGKVCVKAGFCGGIGGHSGDDIDKGRSNAVQSLARLLFRVWSEVPAVLCSIDGGNKRNAIAREASAVIAVNPGDAFTVKNILEEILAELKDEYSVTDPDIASVWEESLPVPSEAIDDSTAFNLIRALHAVPHGVMAMSAEVKGLVEFLAAFPRFMVQGEYYLNRFNRDEGEAYCPQGGYVQAGILLLGRGFDYDSMYAVPGRPSTDKAVELTLRYNYTNLNDRSAQLSGGKESDLSVGVNYYLNRHFGLKLDLHYVFVGDGCNAFYTKDCCMRQMRVQYVF